MLSKILQKDIIPASLFFYYHKFQISSPYEYETSNN